MNTYQILFDFKTYIDESFEDITAELNFIPTKGMSIYFDNKDLGFTNDEDLDGMWLMVKDIDYHFSDQYFIIGLDKLDDFEEE